MTPTRTLPLPRKRRDVEGQLTFTSWLESLPRRAEEADASRPAWRLFCVVLALMSVGFLVQASHAATVLSPAAFRSALLEQAGFRLAALGALLLMQRGGLALARRHRAFLSAVSLSLLVLVFVPPLAEPRNGSNRWVDLGFVTFQPSELARLTLVLWVADRCVRLGGLVSDWRRGVLPILAVVLLHFGLVLIETDVGGAMLLLICALSTMWVGGAHFRALAVALVGVGGGAITAAALFIPYVRSRLQLWFGDAQNPQVEHTLAAMADGGWLGRGLGQGSARNQGVPYLESDYVFAQIGEELGLLGMLVVLGLFCAYLWFSLRLVLSLRNRYEALAAFGLLVSVGLQAMLHVQVVAGLAPPKGMTLPFVSDGGTSLIVSSLAVGLALGAARRTHTGQPLCSPSSAME